MKVPSIKAPSDDPPASPSAPPAARTPLGYLKQLWRAEIPLKRVFWQDMIVAGTAVNLATMGLAFLAVALGASTLAGIAIHLSPAPYNILLVASVWRRADIEPVDWGWPARIGALAWLLFAFVI